MNPLAIPTAHGHIALAVWATPRVAVSPEGAASARKAQKAEGRALARSGGCVVLNPAFTLRCTFAPKRARARWPGRDDDCMNGHVHQAGGAPPNRLSSAVMERASA